MKIELLIKGKGLKSKKETYKHIKLIYYGDELLSFACNDVRHDYSMGEIIHFTIYDDIKGKSV